MGRAKQFPLQSPWQSSLKSSHTYLWTPADSSVGTGSGFGMTWLTVGPPTIVNPSPTTGGPSVVSQMRRTRFSNLVTTTNQVLGVTFSAAEDAGMWRGNAAGLGGFYFAARFVLGTWPASGARLFVGLANSNTSIVVSDTVSASNTDAVGLWHDSADTNNGASRLNVLTMGASSFTKTALTAGGGTGIPNLQSALAMDWEMFCIPNDSTIHWSLGDVNSDAVYARGSIAVTMPTSTVFMGPQVAASNGTANTGAGDVKFEICKVYGATHY